jgi:hypothetical protein
MSSATTSQQFIRRIGAASASALLFQPRLSAALALGLLLLIAVSAGRCVANRHTDFGVTF